MIILFQFLIIILFFLFVYFDFKYRAIPIILFPLGFVLVTLYQIALKSFEELFRYYTINLGIILFVFMAIWLFFSLKSLKIVNLFKEKIGLGDLITFCIIALLFTPLNFVAFILASNVLILLIWLPIQILSKRINPLVPLAGFLSIFAILIIFLDYIKYFEPYNDFAIIQFLSF